MTQVQIKRVYEDPETADGYRVLVDRLWPRGMKKEHLKYDVWEKGITPSPSLRMWFHEDMDQRWDTFAGLYQKELSESSEVEHFIQRIKSYPVVTLLYASKQPVHNHAQILQNYIKNHLSP